MRQKNICRPGVADMVFLSLVANDGEFRRAFKDWQTFVDQASQTVSEADETVPELPSKDIVFRIYRDTRFSKDPTPYKVRICSGPRLLLTSSKLLSQYCKNKRVIKKN